MADQKVTILYELQDKAKKGLEQIGLAADKSRAKLIDLKKASKILAGAFAAMAAAAGTVGYAALKAAGNFEQWEVSFKTMLGSAEEANKLLKEITDFAASTPFELPGLVESSKQLLAFGIEAENIIPTMKSLGDIAAGVGTDKLETLVRAFGKIRTKGRASMEELNMLLEAGVPILDELAKGYGVTNQELLKMISRGQVGFQDVDDALKRLTTGNGKFADLMKAQSETFFGIISNIKDGLTRLAISIGEQLLPEMKRLGNAVKEVFTPENIEAFAKTVTPIIKGLTVTVEALANAFLKVGKFIGESTAKIVGFAESAQALQKRIGENILGGMKSIREKVLGVRQQHREEDLIIEAEQRAEDVERKTLQNEEDLLMEQDKHTRELELANQLADEKAKLAVKELKAQQKQSKEEIKANEEKAKAISSISSDLTDDIISGQKTVGEAAIDSLKKQLGGQIDGIIKTGVARALAEQNYPLAVLITAAGTAAKAAIGSMKFADGGIVPGSSISGDKVRANLNSGEMVLNREQQANLFAIANGQQNSFSLPSFDIESPQSQGSGGSTQVIILSDDGSELAKAMYHKQTDMINRGDLSER